MRTKFFYAIILIFLIGIIYFFDFSILGRVIYSDYSDKKTLGYCPTMQEEAYKISKENDYELIGFDYAIDVLSALKNKQINKAIIGRKAKSNEINQNTKETILKSGYTLVSNRGGFIDYSKLPSIEVHTYIPREVTQDLFPPCQRIIYHQDKSEALNKIQESGAALISWDDWDDDFGLIVVMDGDEKAEDFRGVFLYEN